MFDGFYSVLQWHLMFLLMGIAFYPVSSLLFPQFVDRGYIFGKIIGAIVISYAVFLLGTLHILPFNSFTTLAVAGVTALIMWLFFYRKIIIKSNSFFPTLKKVLPIMIVEEVLFLLILLLWSYIRSFSPDINGLEKFMDYGFVNSILRSSYFPPKDMWFTPEPINYYYFGHLVTAVLSQLSFLPSYLTYNIMMATLAALCFTASFSIGINFFWSTIEKKILPIRLFFIGILAALLVTFAGNLHPIYTLFTSYENENPVPVWELSFSPQTFPNSYWYPNATRFIHNTIHEFPLYSWTVADLHGHVLDIPFVLLTIAFLYSITQQNHSRKNAKKTLRSNRSSRIHLWYEKLSSSLPMNGAHLVFLSFLIAVMYMTNAWDGLIYILLSTLVFVYIFWKGNWLKNTSFINKIVQLLFLLVIPLGILMLGFLIFSLPLSLFFKPFVSGIGVLCAPEFLTSIEKLGPFLFEKDHCQHSPLWQLLILHGFFFFFVILFLSLLVRTKKHYASDYFILLLILLSFLLILLPELIYAKDIYPAHYRANTMFKLVFQSFIMLSLSTAYIIPRLATVLRNNKGLLPKSIYILYSGLTILFLTTVLSYPYFAINSYYNNVFAFDKTSLSQSKGLNGIAYLEKYPDDYKAIQWIQKNVSGQPVILEAQGDSYTDYARVSSNTGLPTVLGWTVHEWLWRGSYDIPAPRIEEVKTLYESNDIQRTNDLLKKYNITYIFLGALEREKYNVNEEKIENLGEAIFNSGKTTIYKITK